eukprot:GEMP01000880.1.p1 GENE.GEMP01000880.1~~GEMP01000880.1.p1  ORF type:complete len:750 (+),score=148.11 GEMP01000880.1:25-2250(+)
MMRWRRAFANTSITVAKPKAKTNKAVADVRVSTVKASSELGFTPNSNSGFLKSIPNMKQDALLSNVGAVLERNGSPTILRGLLTELARRERAFVQAAPCMYIIEQATASRARDPIVYNFLAHRFMDQGHLWSKDEALRVFCFSVCFLNDSTTNYPDPRVVDALLNRCRDSESGEWNLGCTDAAKLLKALVRISYPDDVLVSLGEYVGDHVEDICPLGITEFGWALQQKTFGNDLDIILRADLVKGACRLIHELDGTTIQVVLYNCAKLSYYDEHFLSLASQRLQDPAILKGCSQATLAGLIQNVGNLQWRDPTLGDALCSSVMANLSNGLSEQIAQKVIFGLMRMRHKNEELFRSLAQTLRPKLRGYQNYSLSRILSAFSALHVFVPDFHLALFNELINRLPQLQPMSVQHLLTGMQRFQVDFIQHGHREWLSDIMEKTAKGVMERSMSPVQSLAILMALQKMHFSDPDVISKLVSGFVVPTSGRRYAKEYRVFYPARAWHQLPPCPFDVVLTKELWEKHLDIPAAGQVLQGLSVLECWSAESLWLGLFLKYWVETRLHEMKAKEVLSFAHAFKDWQLPDNAIAYAECVFNGKVSATECAPPRFDGPCTWRGPLINSCLENLRRHEYFMETTWWVLCQLKALDMSLRVLGAPSPVGFEDFRRRLCDLSIEDCARIKEQRLADAADEDSVEATPAEEGEAPACDVTPVWSPGQREEVGAWIVQENGAVDGFSVDLLVSAPPC